MTFLEQLVALPASPTSAHQQEPPAQVTARPVPQANATILVRHDFTDTMAHFTMQLDSALGAFRPGQYVSLGVVEGGALVQRPYSIVAHDEAARRVELFIRRVPNGALSGRLWQLDRGARVRLGPARGLFVLDSADLRQRLFIGTGTGLAPLLAMLEDLAKRGDDTPNVLIHGVSYQDEAVYRHRIGAWIRSGLHIDYLPSVSRPDDLRNVGWAGLTGRADAILARVLDEWPEVRAGVAYMCGNSDMIAGCTTVLREGGFESADIRAEQFHAPTPWLPVDLEGLRAPS